MALAHVATTSNVTTTSATSIAATVSTAGSNRWLIAKASVASVSSHVSTVSGGGLTWTRISPTGGTGASATDYYVEIWAAFAATAITSQTITHAVTGFATDLGLSISEWSGGDASSIGASAAFAETNTAPVVGTVTTTAAGAMLDAGFIDQQQSTHSGGTNTTESAVFNDGAGGGQYYSLRSTSSVSPGSNSLTETVNVAAPDWVGAIVEIKPAAAGAVLQAAGSGSLSSSAALTTAIRPAAAGTGNLSANATLSGAAALQAAGSGKLTAGASLTTGIALGAAGAGNLSGSAILPAFVFPLAVHASGRYLVDATGKPFPILGDSAWNAAHNLGAVDQVQLINDRCAKGFTATLLQVIEHKFSSQKPPKILAGDLPFTLRLDGGSYTGSPNGTTTSNGNGSPSGQTGGNTYAADPYSNVSNEAPDFTQPNATYWAAIDAWVSLCASRGVICFVYPMYFGFAANDEGWNAEMVANHLVTGAGGQTGQSFADPTKSKLWNYGAWLGDRYKAFKNIIWILGGDSGQNGTSGAGTYSTNQSNAVLAVYQGIHSITAAASQNWTGHWGRNTLGSDIVNDVTNGAALAATQTLESSYPDIDTAQQGRAAYAHSPAQPAFAIEEKYEGDEAGGPNRRLQIWTMLGAIGGYFWSAGVGTTGTPGSFAYWTFPIGWQAQLTTPGTLDMQRFNAWWSSLPWWTLVPSGLSGMKTLVTSGGGTASPQSTDYVAAAAAPDGSLLLAYVPPAHTGTITVDMTAMGGLTRSRWWDATNGGYTADATGLANTGTHVFTPPGSNSAGATDFVLVLDISTLSAAGTVNLTSAAALSTSISLAAAGKEGLAATAALTTAIALAASSAGHQDAIAALTTAIRLVASGTGSLSGVAALAGGAVLQASGSGSLASSAALSTSIALQAAGSGSLSGSAALGVPAALQAAGSGGLSASAQLTTALQLAAAGAVQVAAAASLTTAVRMAAAGRGSLSASASLSTSVIVKLARGAVLKGQPTAFATLKGQAGGYPVLLGQGDS